MKDAPTPPLSAKVWEKIGMTREEIVAAVRNIGRPHFVQKPNGAKPRPICMICGNPIGKRTCRPVKQKYFDQKLATFVKRKVDDSPQDRL